MFNAVAHIVTKAELAEIARLSKQHDDEYADYGRPVEVTGQLGSYHYTRQGTLYRTLRNTEGAPVYEVRFGQHDIQRLASGRETLRFLDN